jgi:[ribosomal protein S5]-alanine N-acetyltransferase
VRDLESERAFDFGIFATGSDELVGRVRLSEIVRGVFQNAYIGYFVSERHNGRGFATAGVRQAVNTAFGPIELHRVQAAVVPRNVGSVRVLEKVGFRDEGLALRYLEINGAWEDHRLFAVTREEWPSSR